MRSGKDVADNLQMTSLNAFSFKQNLALLFKGHAFRPKDATNPLTCEDRMIPNERDKHHGLWFPGPLSHQGINTQYIDYEHVE